MRTAGNLEKDEAQGRETMKQFKAMVAATLILTALSLASYLAYALIGGGWEGIISLIQTAIVGMALLVSLVLLASLDRGTLPRRVWGTIAVGLVIMFADFILDTINGFAGRELIPQTISMSLYALVFVPIVAALFLIYFGYRRAGYEFKKEGMYALLPSLGIITVITVVVVMVPLVTGDVDLATKVSNFIVLIALLAVMFLIAFIAVTLGRGDVGMPWLLLSLALACLIVHTIITSQIGVVGMIHPVEPADLLLSFGYGFLALSGAYQYRLSSA